MRGALTASGVKARPQTHQHRWKQRKDIESIYIKKQTRVSLMGGCRHREPFH